MKRKEKKQFAEKLAKLERIVQLSQNDTEIEKAQQEIIRITSHIGNFEDLMDIDEMVSELLDF